MCIVHTAICEVPRFDSDLTHDPVAAVLEELSCATVSLLGRLEKLAAYYDVASRRYRNEALDPLIGPEKTEAACSVAHKLIWRDWIRFSLEQQLADIAVYLESSPGASYALLLAWRTAPPLALWAPPDAPSEERQLAVSNLVTISVLFCRAHPPRRVHKEQIGNEHPPDTVTAHVLALMHEMYADPLLSVRTISGLTDVSERHIGRLLKQHTGLTFAQYVRRLRVERAKSVLIASEESIKEISLLVGYNEVSWFSRYFRAATGSTPAQFRKQQCQNILQGMADFA